MFGTDSTVPEEYRLAILAEQREVFERLIVADADRRAVFGENARRLFRLPGSKRA
jgi:predicted TIM-barrel fold metal-dependent hydrolase